MELDGAVSRPNYHMAFTGNPGTGKTTVAGIIARLFHRLGILEQPSVKVVDRSRLVGRFVGETERNTSRAIDEAMGGVIFVDEAYQLHTESFDRDFGRQAIETFMTRLENDRDAFVAIFAGYTDEMDRFLDANPGLRSRVPWVLEFPDFTAEEVARIVVARLAKDWTFDPEILAGVATAAYDRADPRDRTNGRWARNFAERIESEQIEHIAATGLVGPAMKRIPDEVILAFGE
jgi:SpoVK/Ycf46/Vps4 family AAA+-type ATPase